ncbi:MAG: DNA-deoxyinosine glycosylase [Eubacteriales bacterium]|nr:DNA-deoxyinosine glycosylase [Clostridiales bacterium]MDY3286274.1 DNA-deoxyinosine glycosylase [Eubacteriales bacterium]
MEAFVTHPFAPVCGEGARLLILGSFPSVRSREEGFYYGHPRNRFWQVLARIYGEPVPASVPEKRALLFSHGLALWDVVSSCRVTGSSDASIREAEPNDIPGLCAASGITRVFANGRTAAALYRRAGFSPEITVLPSTSPANAAWSVSALADAWGKALLLQ